MDSSPTANNAATTTTPTSGGGGNNPLQFGCDDHWTWNRRDKSHEVRLYGSRHRTAHFHPNWSNGTAGVRGTRVLSAGSRHYWEIEVSQRIFGTSMMFGVGTRRARLHANAFVNLLGEDDQSWGLSHKGLLWHNGAWHSYTKPFRENEATVVGVLFDGHLGSVTFYKDGVCLGVAFSDLGPRVAGGESLYPVVCSTAAKTEMTLGTMRRDFVNLQDRCRSSFLRHVGVVGVGVGGGGTSSSSRGGGGGNGNGGTNHQIERLVLPNRIKSYLMEGLDDLHESNNNSHGAGRASGHGHGQGQNNNPHHASRSGGGRSGKHHHHHAASCYYV